MANVGGIAGDRLRSLIERIERLEEERRALGEDIREVYSEAKSAGFDVKVMRQIVRLRKMDKADRDEQEALRLIARAPRLVALGLAAAESDAVLGGALLVLGAALALAEFVEIDRLSHAA